MNCHAQRIGPEEIERIKRETDLYALVSRHVELKRHNGDEFVGLCPFHSEATPSFYVIPKKGICHCFGCKKTLDAIEFLQEVEKLSFREAVDKLRGGSIAPREGFKPADPKKQAEDEAAKRQKKIIAARRIWDEAVPAFGTIVEKYLASRGLSGVMIPPSIRFHPRVWHADTRQELPAMIGCVMCNGKIVGVHRTYLAADGRSKANVSSAKKMLGACSGGHLRIDDYGPKLVIAEGIETALSVKKACPGLPVWAALSLGNMGAQVPKAVTELILCADGDNKDQKAADAVLAKAAALHAQTGRTVRIARPPAGKDFNDVVVGRG